MSDERRPDATVLRTYSHTSFYFVATLLLLGFSFYCWGLLVIDANLVSRNGLIAVLVLGVGTWVVASLIPRFWRSSVTFTVSDRILMVTHPFSKERDEVEWTSIVSVEVVPQSFMTWGAARRFSRVIVEDGREFWFAAHLSDYAAFIEDVRVRAVNCRRFTPQIDLI